MIRSPFPAPLTAAHQKPSVGFNRFFGEDIAAKETVKAVRIYPLFLLSFFWRLRQVCGTLNPVRRALANAEIPA